MKIVIKNTIEKINDISDFVNYIPQIIWAQTNSTYEEQKENKKQIEDKWRNIIKEIEYGEEYQKYLHDKMKKKDVSFMDSDEDEELYKEMDEKTLLQCEYAEWIYSGIISYDEFKEIIEYTHYLGDRDDLKNYIQFDIIELLDKETIQYYFDFNKYINDMFKDNVLYKSKKENRYLDIRDVEYGGYL